ncbi:MAG TPA: DNA primase [Burkholderiaceae bacterium]|nr:DNA primase [Burkholderiaceae bacterium]
MLPNGFIQELVSRVDILEVVGRHVELKRAGSVHKGLCPFHGEKSPSFTVSPSRQTYHCFGCGAHGDAIRFLMENQGLPFMDAVRELAQRVGITVPDNDASPEEQARAAEQRAKRQTLTDVLTRAAEHYKASLKASPRAIEYLKGRGLTGEIAARFGLGYASPGWRALASVFPRYDDPLLVEAGLVIVQGDEGSEDQKRYDRFRDRVMFPIRSVRGEVIGFGGRVIDDGEPKYLNSPETPLFVKGRELYGLYEARAALREAGYALVVEGYMDVVALAQSGFAQAVATLGTACTPEHVAKLFRFTDHVVFSFDGDAAGRRAAGRALEAALPHATDLRSVRFLFLPPEHDPDSYVRELGADAFARAVAEAVPLSRQLLEHAAQECDLDTAEGRARMLSQARPLWDALPEGVLRAQLLDALAERGRMAVAELARIWGRATTLRRPSPRSPSDHRAAPEVRRLRPGPKLPSPANHIVAGLLAESQLWHEVSAHHREVLLALDSWHGDLLRWLDRHLENHGPQPWPALREDLQAAELGDWAGKARGLVDGAEVPTTYGLPELERLIENLAKAKEQEHSDGVKQAVMRQPNRL